MVERVWDYLFWSSYIVVGCVEMRGINCDECGIGYKPGQLIDCRVCGAELCGGCMRIHTCNI